MVDQLGIKNQKQQTFENNRNRFKTNLYPFIGVFRLLAKLNETPPWNIQDLKNVLDKLKNNKSRDPNGLANELFKEEAAGEDFKVAILKLMNRIKNEQKYPKCLEVCNITSIWVRFLRTGIDPELCDFFKKFGWLL